MGSDAATVEVHGAARDTHTAISRLVNVLPAGLTIGLSGPGDQGQIVALLHEQGVCWEGVDYREFGAGGTTLVAKNGDTVIALLSGHLGKPISWIMELASRRTLRPRVRLAVAVAMMAVWEELMMSVGSQVWGSVCDLRLPHIRHLTTWYGAEPIGTTTVFRRLLVRGA